MADLGSSTDIPVYLGVWTNWSKGKIAGATLTLTHRDGALLTAFLAIFITFAGTSFWQLASFVLHQSLSSDDLKDGLYHQIQAVLRNSGNGSCIIRLLRILWVWRRKANRPFRRVSPIIVATALSSVIFAVASIFSARISSEMGNEALISGPSCGWLYEGDPNVVQYDTYTTIAEPWISRQANSYANYVQTCYNNVSETEGCSLFIKRQLPSTIDRNATCPFQAEDVCRHKYRNIKLDTGTLYVDSDLGLNVPSDLRYTLRISTHCAPLATERYRQNYNFSTETAYTRYFYGRQNNNDNQPTNKTYTYESQILSDAVIQSENFHAGMADYRLGVSTAYTYGGSLNLEYSNFIPIDDLLPTQKNSDVFLFFLSARDVRYTNEVNDDWYAAHRPIGTIRNQQPSDSGHAFVYAADEAAAVLGCQVHYQICRPKSSPRHSCPVSGGYDDLSFPNILEDKEANGLIEWFFNSILALPDVVGSLMTSSLTSRHGLADGTQGPLPDDQWQSEVENWHNITLTSLQSVVNSAIGPNDPGILKYFWASPKTSGQKYLCKNQKIRSSAYSNFSVLGLVIVLTVGGLIIILGYTFEHIIALVESRRSQNKYSRLEWSANDILQTQRMAQEELGRGTWENCAGVGAIPVTEKNQMLAPLDIQDPTHPRLKTESAPALPGKVEASSSTQVASTGVNGERSLAATTASTSGDEPSSRSDTQINSVSGEDRLEDELGYQPSTSPAGGAEGIEEAEIYNGTVPGDTSASRAESFEDIETHNGTMPGGGRREGNGVGHVSFYYDDPGPLEEGPRWL